MRKVYVIQYIPSGQWIYSRDNQNIITLSALESCKLYQKKPDVSDWFKARYPIQFTSYEHAGMISPNDFQVQTLVMELPKNLYIKTMLFYSYCFILYLFKLPLIVSLAIYDGINIIIKKSKEFLSKFKKKKKYLDRHSHEFIDDYIENSRMGENSNAYWNRVYGGR